MMAQGVRLKCYYDFFLVRCGCDTSYIVSVHIQCQASIYTLSVCRGHSWRVRLAKQETLTPPGHLVSPLVCRGLWMSTVVLYCWCHSDSASFLLCFTFELLHYSAASQHKMLTPGPVLFSTCIYYNDDTIHSWTCHVYGLFECRTSLGTSILLSFVKVTIRWKLSEILLFAPIL